MPETPDGGWRKDEGTLPFRVEPLTEKERQEFRDAGWTEAQIRALEKVRLEDAETPRP